MLPVYIAQGVLLLAHLGERLAHGADGTGGVYQCAAIFFLSIVIADRRVASSRQSGAEEVPCYFSTETLFRQLLFFFAC